METDDREYTDRMLELDSVRWRKALDVQAPYRWQMRRLCVGRTLDVGCGIGRNLAHLAGRAVGIDHNAFSIRVAQERGFSAFTPDEFRAAPESREQYDTLLVAHVLEHLDEGDADKLLTEYLEFLRPGGRLVAVTPQEKLYAKDSTHIRWVDEDELAAHARRADLVIEQISSYPMPRFAGRLFPYNEFYLVAHRR